MNSSMVLACREGSLPNAPEGPSPLPVVGGAEASVKWFSLFAMSDIEQPTSPWVSRYELMSGAAATCYMFSIIPLC